MKHPDLKVIKADVNETFKMKVKERAKSESICETELIKKAVKQYLETPLKKRK